MKLFVDASGWTALFNPRDQYYFQVRGKMQMILGQINRLVTTDYVLDETITNLMSTVNHPAAEKFAVWVLSQKHIRVVHIDEELWDEALALFQKYDDKDFSFTDCTSFVVMQQQKLRDVFSFDHHFEQMNFRLWPK